MRVCACVRACVCVSVCVCLSVCLCLYVPPAPKEDPTPAGLDQRELLKRNYMKTYFESCKKLGVHPVQPVAASLADTHIVLKTRGLGVNGARAIAIALVVRLLVVFVCERGPGRG